METIHDRMVRLDNDSNVSKWDAMNEVGHYVREECDSYRETCEQIAMRNGLIYGVIIGIAVGAALTQIGL